MSDSSSGSGSRPGLSDSSSGSGSRPSQSDTKAERLAGALDEFLAASPDVEAAAVVSFDGLVMASALPPDMDEDRLGAMSAALLSLGEQAAAGLGRGELSQVFVEGQHGYVFLMSARDQAVLAAVTGRAAKIGLMLFEMRRAAEVIGRVLEGVAPAEDDGADATGHAAVAAAEVVVTEVPAAELAPAQVAAAGVTPAQVPAPTGAALTGDAPEAGADRAEADESRPHNGSTPAGTILPPWN